MGNGSNADKRSVYDRLPENLKEILITTAGIGVFVSLFFRIFWRRPYEWQEILRQCYLLGFKTLMLVSITGFIMGLVMTLQSEPILETFGAESWLPSMVSISIFRELGPIIAGLICAGKIGSGIGAELGSMKVAEQIDAMEVSGANPFKYLVVTRVLATTITIPILVFYTDAVAMLGSFIAINFNNTMDLQLFISLALDPMVFADIIPATLKSIFFGFAIGIISCYMGYQAERGTESVGIAANRAVVVSSLTIFLIDLAAVEITNMFLY